jgi:hypothetical protein
MNNVLSLLVGISLGLSTLLAYELRKVKAHQNSVVRSLGLLKECFDEVIKINTSLIKRMKELEGVM